jgi:hypothetical protein
VPGKRKPQAFRRKGSPRAKSQRISATNKARRVPASQLSERSFSARERSQHALVDMRHGVSPSQAARDNGVTLRTLKKYVGSALVQGRSGGRIRVRKSDRLVRYLQLPGLHGPVDVDAQGSKEATRAARYKAAINRFLRGDLKALAPWKGKKIAGVELITDGGTLKRLAHDELLPYSLYRSLSGGRA